MQFLQMFYINKPLNWHQIHVSVIHKDFCGSLWVLIVAVADSWSMSSRDSIIFQLKEVEKVIAAHADFLMESSRLVWVNLPSADSCERYFRVYNFTYSCPSRNIREFLQEMLKLAAAPLVFTNITEFIIKPMWWKTVSGVCMNWCPLWTNHPQVSY